jgi:hypothetical protein
MEIQRDAMMRQVDYQAYREAREAQKTERIEKLKETAPVEQLQELTETERNEGINYLNNSMAAVEKFSETKYPRDLSCLFPPASDDKTIHDATVPRENDNDEAKEVRSEYKELFQEIKKDLSYAKLLASKLGPGTHELTDKNGRKIATVIINEEKDGDVHVSIEKPDGRKTEVTYNEEKPGDCTIEKTDKHGRKESMKREGTNCSRTRDGKTESYDVDDEGRVVREKSGPGSDDREKTVVNKDGSTDDYTLIYYDENNEPVYDHDHKDPKSPEYKDAGAGQAIEALKKENPKGKITGDQMEKLIIDATKDPDNQAAGKEYEDLKKFVDQNKSRLSPDAKAKWEVYDKHVQEAKQKGQTGIPFDEYEKMKKEIHEAKGKTEYKDASAGKAIDALNKENPKGEISGDQMEKLIIDATKDFDNQAAGKEYEDLKKFVDQNKNRLSPDAKAKWEVYDKYVQEAKHKGQTGIPAGEYAKMKKEIHEAKGKEHYEDAGAGKAIDALNKENPKGEITGDEIYKLIVDGTKDLDNQSAGKEYDDLKKYVEQNWNRLSPEAKAKWEVYEDFAREARARGESGMNQEDYQIMLREMQAAGKPKPW